MKKNLFLLIVSVTLVFLFGTSISFAVHGDPKDYGAGCDCHGLFTDNLGLHNDVGTGDTCRICHKPHEALSSSKLLPAARQSEVCFTCHDGTTGDLDGDTDNSNVIYGQITYSPATGAPTTGAAHNIDIVDNDSTIQILGLSSGDSVNPTLTVPYGTNLTADLECSGCHTPHGSNPITTQFTSKNSYTNTKLLKQTPGDTTTATTLYGTNWCRACHDDAYGGAMADHPMSTNVSYNSPLDHGVTPTASYRPLCQSCHDDAQDIANFPTHSEPGPALDNFPHEASNDKFLVETGDDLCLNCHQTSGLP